MIDTEILSAKDELKSGETEGCDGIPDELLKALKESYLFLKLNFD